MIKSVGKYMSLQTVLTVGIVLLLSYSGCVRDNISSPPVFVDVVEDVSITVNDSLVLSIKYVEGYDSDGDEITLFIGTGENYSISGTTIVPDSNFIGDIFLPLQLIDKDGSSNIVTMIISVVEEVVIMPLYAGSWWSYDDSVPDSDTVLTSRLEITNNDLNFIIDSVTGETALSLTWSNLAEYGINYLVGNEMDGLYQYGVYNNDHTVLKTQLWHMYPCEINSSWQFAEIKYNITDTLFYENVDVPMVCTDTLVYIKVPAGTFPCYEYTYTHNSLVEKVVNPGIDVNMLGTRSRATGGVFTKKIYFSEGVGYVQLLTLSGDQVLWKKVLTEYYVEDSEER